MVDARIRPVPEEVEPQYAPYFEGLAQGVVLAPRCLTCGNLQWPRRPLCSRCHGVSFTWDAMPSEATLYTFTVIYRAFHPWFAERVPYGVVVGDFGNGVRILGNLFGADVARLRCDLPLRPEIVPAGAIHVLEWRIA